MNDNKLVIDTKEVLNQSERTMFQIIGELQAKPMSFEESEVKEQIKIAFKAMVTAYTGNLSLIADLRVADSIMQATIETSIDYQICHSVNAVLEYAGLLYTMKLLTAKEIVSAMSNLLNMIPADLRDVAIHSDYVDSELITACREYMEKLKVVASVLDN